jgi:hypothetical protein
MKTFAYLLAFCSLLPMSVRATTLPRLPVEDLYQKANVVAVIQIESGSVIDSGGHQCGARYTGRILEAMKGPLKKDDPIEFGPFPGYGVGNHALVFLNDSAKVYSPKASTNSSSMAREAEYKEAGGGPGNLHSGIGGISAQ